MGNLFFWLILSLIGIGIVYLAKFTCKYTKKNNELFILINTVSIVIILLFLNPFYEPFNLIIKKINPNSVTYGFEIIIGKLITYAIILILFYCFVCLLIHVNSLFDKNKKEKK